jgi:hypothetical protein
MRLTQSGIVSNPAQIDNLSNVHLASFYPRVLAAAGGFLCVETRRFSRRDVEIGHV